MNQLEYVDFIRSKTVKSQFSNSIRVDRDDLNPHLYQFQRDIVRWALAKGRAAVFADCGLGKTLMQLEWANQVCRHHGGGYGSDPGSTQRFCANRAGGQAIWYSGHDL